MKKRFVWLLASCLVVVALLAAACAPAVVKEAAPAVPTGKEAAPTVKESVIATASISPAVQKIETGTTSETVKVTLKKNDGTVVVKDYVKPKYGGIGRFSRTGTVIVWDQAFSSPWGVMAHLPTNESLIQGDWARGPAGTAEVAFVTSGWVRLDYIYGMLAESWEWPDDSTAIFHIRQGVHYALDPKSAASRLVNGREFTADDVVWNIRRNYIDNPVFYMFGMAGVSRPTEVYAKDKWTVVLKSAKGQIGKSWEYVGDWSHMVPREVVEKYGDMNQWENVVGTGPFILTDYVPMSSITWVRNPNYWMKDPLLPENQLPYMDGLKVYMIPDISTNLAAIRTAKIDWLTNQTWENSAPLIKGTPELNYCEHPQTTFTSLHMRVDKPELPFKDIRVRRALLMAYNQQEIIDTYYSGHAQIVPAKVVNLDIFKDVWTPIDQLPPSADGFDNRKLYGYYTYPDIPKEDKVRQEEANLAEARKLLADAGYPNGFKFEAVVSSASPANIDQLLIAKAQWAKIGVELILNVKEAAVYSDISLRKTHKEAITGGRWAGEPYGMFTVRAGNQFAWAMIDNPFFEDYYNKITALYFDPVARDKVTKEMNLATIDYVPFCVFPYPYAQSFWWPWVKNFDGVQSLDVGGVYYHKYFWLDQDLKKSMGYK